MISGSDSNRILNALEASSNWGGDLRREAMVLLHDLPGYNWCGIYCLDGALLELDEYIGEETEHTHIPVGQGVCGTAVATNSNQVIEDVQAIGNYLACSIKTRSEIVVLIADEGGAILGQIDIDGHSVGAFDRSDEEFLERVARILAIRW
jgi:GAF domain-containing protein